MARLVHAVTGVIVSVPDEDVARLGVHGYRPEGAGDGAPKGNASREEWAAYADSLGVEYDEDAKRDDIKAAVQAAAEQD